MVDSILAIGLGAIVGLLLNSTEKLEKWIDRWMMIAIWLLIFFMGMSFGLKIEIPMLKTIGLQSLIYTFYTSLFSVLVVYFLMRLEQKRRKQKP